ncbi:MAG: hypothetical protein LUC43_04935 [Burkholderiales bacterium]|nr:hypothetical protein [Burkholderiales bacterium]
MFKIRKIIFSVFIASVLGFQGCAPLMLHDKGPDVVPGFDAITEGIVQGKTKLSQVRERLGAPTFIARTTQNKQLFAAYVFTNGVDMDTKPNWINTVGTIGFVLYPQVVKVLLLKLNKKGVITGVDMWGVTYNRGYAFTALGEGGWGEKERPLTAEELKQPIDYDPMTIILSYNKYLANKLNVPIYKVPSSMEDKKFPLCSYRCHAELGAEIKLGKFEMVDENPQAEAGDRKVQLIDSEAFRASQAKD